MRSLVRGLLVAVIGVGLTVGAVWAQSNDVEADLKKLDTQVKAAQAAVKAKDVEKSKAALDEADATLTTTKDAAAAKPATKRAWEAAEKSIAGAKRLYERLPGAVPAAMPAAPKPGMTAKPGAPTTAAAGSVSFMKDVAPVLSAKCGNCHMGNAMRGKFSMATFTALERGADGATVISAGKGSSSRLVEVIADGSMPPQGAKVSADELASITKWIDEGAKFDGPDKNAMLRGARPAPVDRPMLQVAKPTGKETISFARDVAPVLASCTGCHGGQNPSQNLSVATFTRILRGGDSGLAVTPNKGGESLLIKKLKGTAKDGARMPLRRDPLDDATIAKIQKWIDEGASFDGKSPEMATEMVAAIYEAQHMTTEELAAKREGLSKSNWRLGNPDVAPASVKTDHFNIVGNIPEARLEEVGQTAEQQYEKVRDLFKIPDDEEMFKGKLTLFVFNKRFEYREFGTMVEKRSLPEDWRGHWRYNVIDAYAAISPPSDGKDTLERLMYETISGAYIETLGEVPMWFSQGAAKAVSAKMEPKNLAILDWEKRLPTIVSGLSKPDALVTGDVNASDSAVLSYAFCKALLSKTVQYQQLLRALKAGDDFATAFMKAYKADPNTVVSAFVVGAAGRGGR